VAQKNTAVTDVKSHLYYPVDRVRRENHKEVDQEAALFRPSEFQYPCNSQGSRQELWSHSYNMIFHKFITYDKSLFVKHHYRYIMSTPTYRPTTYFSLIWSNCQVPVAGFAKHKTFYHRAVFLRVLSHFVTKILGLKHMSRFWHKKVYKWHESLLKTELN